MVQFCNRHLHIVINKNWQWVNNQKFPLLAQWNTHASTQLCVLQFLVLHFLSCTIYFIQINLLFNIVIHVNKTRVSSTYSSNISPPHHARLKARIHNFWLSIKLRTFWIANGNNYSTVMLYLSYGCTQNWMKIVIQSL